MDIEELKILLAVEPIWTIHINGDEFHTLRTEEIALDGVTLRWGKWVRKIESIEWLKAETLRILARRNVRSQLDTLILHPGTKLPSTLEIRKRRRTFQKVLDEGLRRYFGERKTRRLILHSDRSNGIGTAYVRYLIGKRAVIAVDPDEDQKTVNGLLRAALLWSGALGRRVTVVVPKFRSGALSERLLRMPQTATALEWLQWDGESVLEFDPGRSAVPATEVRPLVLPDVALVKQVQQMLEMAPDVLRAVPTVGGNSVSVRFRGLEVASVGPDGTVYPLGEPLPEVIGWLRESRRHSSCHPMARAYEERWLESNIIDDIGRLLPSVDADYVYPQVPSFSEKERNVIDLLMVTRNGRLVVTEIKASSDPDLPFQALDYWIAVERHRVRGDFQRNGYFKGIPLVDKPAILVFIAPLLCFHRTLGYLRQFLPLDLPLIEIGLNQAWKKEIQILRRQGLVG